MDDNNNSNFILALVLSFVALFVWQIFFGFPALQKERGRKEQAASQQAAPGAHPSTAPQPSERQSALAARPERFM